MFVKKFDENCHFDLYTLAYHLSNYIAEHT